METFFGDPVPPAVAPHGYWLDYVVAPGRDGSFSLDFEAFLLKSLASRVVFVDLLGLLHPIQLVLCMSLAILAASRLPRLGLERTYGGDPGGA